MVISKEMLNKIKDFGLNSYEARLWLALLSRGISTAGELSDIATVPRSRTYDVLESLEKKGFIIMKLGKPIKYIAVDPSEVVERLKKFIRTDADERAHLLEQIHESAVLEELKLLHNKGVELVNPTDLTGSFRGREHIYSHLETMIKGAQTSVVLVTTKDGFLHKMPMFFKHFDKAVKRGVTVQIAAPLSEVTGNQMPELPEGVQVRSISDDFRARFMIVDGKEIAFMVLDDAEVHPSFDVGIWVNSQFFSASLSQMFALAWKDMKQVKLVTR